MFIGRTQELNDLQKAIKKVNSATMIYGKRRIGKTTLAKEACDRNHQRKARERPQ